MVKAINRTQKITPCIALLIFLFYFVFSLSNISALGISPGKIMINFSSGMEKTLDFSVVNNENNNIEVKPYTGGELVQYLSCQKEPLKVTANSAKQFSCKLTLPKNMEAGTYEGRVGISELSLGENNVNVVLSVESRILIFIPEKKINRIDIALFVLFLLIIAVIIVINATKKKNK